MRGSPIIDFSHAPPGTTAPTWASGTSCPLEHADALPTGGTEMLLPFPDFATYPTQHCVTGSMKHVYDYHGFPISEDLLLGLGRGLGFTYFHIRPVTCCRCRAAPPTAAA